MKNKFELILPEFMNNAVIYEVNIRQFTQSGTFAEFEQHLPRLQKLGVKVLWFMPIQPIGKKNRKGTLGSYYSIQNYTAVNQEFGTLDEFKKLIEKIHNLGMYVLLDWVANHTAWDNVWTDEHPDFYTKNQDNEFTAPHNEWSDVIHLNYKNVELRKTMIEAMKFWVNTCNIDGFRCDMAHLVPTTFWNEARTELDRVKPLYLLAESENRELLEYAFNTLYGWNILHTINRIAKGENFAWDIEKLIDSEIVHFPQNATQMLFTSNHDENSWQGSAVERLGAALEPLNVFVFTFTGIPLIYCGQEAGNSRRISFFEKDFIEWKEDKMFAFFQKLIDLRKRNKALWCGQDGGKFTKISTDKNMEIFAYIRIAEAKKVLVVLNLSNFNVSVNLKINEFEGEYYNIFAQSKIYINPNQHWYFRPWEYLVLEI